MRITSPDIAMSAQQSSPGLALHDSTIRLISRAQALILAFLTFGTALYRPLQTEPLHCLNAVWPFPLHLHWLLCWQGFPPETRQKTRICLMPSQMPSTPEGLGQLFICCTPSEHFLTVWCFAYPQPVITTGVLVSKPVFLCYLARGFPGSLNQH